MSFYDVALIVIVLSPLAYFFGSNRHPFWIGALACGLSYVAGSGFGTMPIF